MLHTSTTSLAKHFSQSGFHSLLESWMFKGTSANRMFHLDFSALFFPPHRCSVCFDLLTNWYFEKEGRLYCHKHYCEKFGELCHGCSLLMTGPAMVRKAMWTCPNCERVKKLTFSRKVLRRSFLKDLLTCARIA